MRVLLVIAALGLAGCTSPVAEQRADDLFIHVLADGPWRIGVPLPSDDGASPDYWASVLRVSQGNASLEVGQSPEGTLLWLTGSQSADVEGLDARSLRDADAFMDGDWTVPSTPQGLRIFIDQGSIDFFSIKYEADSCRGTGCADGAGPGNQVCSLTFSASNSGLSPGWQLLPIRSQNRQCTQAP